MEEAVMGQVRKLGVFSLDVAFIRNTIKQIQYFLRTLDCKDKALRCISYFGYVKSKSKIEVKNVIF